MLVRGLERVELALKIGNFAVALVELRTIGRGLLFQSAHPRLQLIRLFALPAHRVLGALQ